MEQDNPKNADQKMETKTGHDLLEEALKQPGVREAIAVFERCQQVERDSKPYTDTMRPRRIISTASASTPLI